MALHAWDGGQSDFGDLYLRVLRQFHKTLYNAEIEVIRHNTKELVKTQSVHIFFLVIVKQFDYLDR